MVKISQLPKTLAERIMRYARNVFPWCTLPYIPHYQVTKRTDSMTSADRLILYVAQRISDEHAYPSRTKLLKTIYLIDVEYYRRNRETLTKWDWKFYHYGPYVMEFPKMLERLDLADLSETEDRDAGGKRYFKYYVNETQILDDVVNPGEVLAINKIIKKWALENLNSLLNYVYFETEPMRDARRGDHLDFAKIRTPKPISSVARSDVAPSKELVANLRNKLAKAAIRIEEEKKETSEILSRYPFIADEAYQKSMEDIDARENYSLPDGATVLYVGQ